MKIQIDKAHLLCPRQKLDQLGTLYVADGKIVATSPQADFTPDLQLDAAGKYLCPGLVDVNVNCCEPGFEHKGTIASETRAAAKGGITSIVCPPNTQPIAETPAVIELMLERARTANSRVYPMGALTQGLAGKNLTEMAALKSAGCLAVSNSKRPIRDSHVLQQAFSYAANFALTVFYYPDDDTLSRGACIHEGFISTRLGLPGIPPAAESIAVARALLLQQATGVRLHLCQLSTASSIELVRQAKARGQDVSADVAIHQLYFIEQDVAGFDSTYHVLPPFRSQEDRSALLEGLADGTLDMVCSDHTPHEANAKMAPFSESAPGIVGLESLLPLLLGLKHESRLDLLGCLAKVTSAPAQRLGLAQGSLTPGSPADIVLFDPHVTWQLEPQQLFSAGKNTPFLGWPMSGQVQLTLVQGQVTYRHEDGA